MPLILSMVRFEQANAKVRKKINNDTVFIKSIMKNKRVLNYKI